MKKQKNDWSEGDFGFQKEANPGRQLESSMGNKEFYRYPVRTHLVQIGEDYLEVIEKYAGPSIKQGDLIVCSEKFIGICQKRVVHESEIKESWLAKLIARYVVKYPDDIGWENPKKIQVAIDQVGYPRTLLAVAFGGIMKFVFRRPGWYYRIMGKDVEAIDGFNPIAIPPFNEYALLAPARPNEVCNEIKERLKAPAVIVDASNVAIHILGRSEGISLTDDELVQVMTGNPMGQGREQTPIIIVRSA